MTTATPTLNEVDLSTVAALAAQIQQRPEAAQSTWKAVVCWTGGFTSEAHVRHFKPIKSDEPSTLGGTDTAPNPVEQLLSALGNCLAVGYAANASAAAITIRSLRISIEGNIDLRTFLGLTQGNAGYDAIKVTVKLESDASQDRLDALHRTVIGTSPVGHSLERAVPVKVELWKPVH